MWRNTDKKKLIGAGCSKKEGEYIITFYRDVNEEKLNIKVKRIKITLRP